ncbi:MAG: hypothetical protein H5T84_08920, partial [Thermoleophilia bacterium]|nr:hypothetical protein [Thermoleophilia bacterium]
MRTAGSAAQELLPKPLQVARQVLDRATVLGLSGAVEAYVQVGRTTELKVFAGRAESVQVGEPRGLGVRFISRRRLGYAYTSDFSTTGLDQVLLAAAANAEEADPDPFLDLPAGDYRYVEIPGLWQPGVARTTLADKLALVLAAEKAAYRVPGVTAVEESLYSDVDLSLAVASTAGVAVEAELSHCVLYVMAHAGEGKERQSGQGFSAGRDPAELDAESAGGEAGERARSLLGASPCETGVRTVVLAREV